jgi:hypothetical protein
MLGENLENISSKSLNCGMVPAKIICYMKLHLDGKAPTTARSPMKKIASLVALMGLVVLVNGCTTVQNYSLRSYQGPLPMDDYTHISAESYGAPAAVLK